MYASMFSLEIYCNTQNELAHPRRIVLIFYICGLCPYTEELIFSVISLGSIFGAINCCTNLQYQQTLTLRAQEDHTTITDIAMPFNKLNGTESSICINANMASNPYVSGSVQVASI